VDGAGLGKASTPPMVMDVAVEKPGNPSPLTVIWVPEDALVSSRVMAAPGTAWEADPVGAFVDEDVTNTVLVEGMLALVGTVRVAVKLPRLSGVAEDTVVPA